MRATPLVLVVLALLLAGCSVTNTRTSDLTVSSTQSFEHDYREGTEGAKDLDFPYRGSLRVAATFSGTSAAVAGMHLCPDDADEAVIEVVGPDGRARDVMNADISGLNGTGGCGTMEREVRVDEPGVWRLRFRGQVEMSVRGEAHVFARSSL